MGEFITVKEDGMLVLSRKVGESILIGDNIEIMLVDISHNRIKIGVLAPKEVLVLRKELTMYTGPRPSQSPQPPQPKETI